MYLRGGVIDLLRNGGVRLLGRGDGDLRGRCLAGGDTGRLLSGMYESISGASPRDKARGGREGDPRGGDNPRLLPGLVSRGSYRSLLLDLLNRLLSL